MPADGERAMPAGATDTIDLRRSAGDRYLTAFGAVFLVFPAAFMLVIAAATVRQTPGLALFILGVGLFMALLVAVVVREALDRWSTRIRITGDSVDLRLPHYLNRPPLRTTVPLAAIAAVDWRQESFRSLGLTAMHEAYALALKDGGRLVLGGDKAMTQPFFATAAEAIAERAGAPIRDLGMVDGKGGVLQVAGMSAPEWTARSLAPDQIARRRRGVELTWLIMSAAIGVAFVAQALGALF